ncbi:hypothetical protein [Clostridium botulinum]
MDDILFDSVDKVRFVKRPIPVPYNYRIMYKIAQIVLVIGTCCGKRGCSLEKLHMICMGLVSKDEMCNLIQFTKGKLTNYNLIRFNPAINRAVSFAIGDKIIFRQKNGLFRLTQEGKIFLNEIKHDKDLLLLEKAYLKDISNNLTEERINEVMAEWRVQNV